MSGGSSVVWWTTVTGWKAGTCSPGSSSAAARAPVANRTARQGSSPWSRVVTLVVETVPDLDAGVDGARREGGREKLRERVRAALRQAQAARREGVQRQVGAAAGGLQVRVAEQRGEQGAQEAVDRAGREAPGGQRLCGGEIGAGEEAGRWDGGEAGERGAETGLVEGAAEGPGPGGSALGAWPGEAGRSPGRARR